MKTESNYASTENFEYFFSSLLNIKEQSQFLEKNIKDIAKLALKQTELFKNSKIEILQQGQLKTQKLTREQAACLLANMFLCTTVNQCDKKLPSQYQLNEVYNKEKYEKQYKNMTKPNKIKCIYVYLILIIEQIEKDFSQFLSQEIYFDRVCLNLQFNIEDELMKKEIKFQNLKIDKFQSIQDYEIGIQADFANKFIGGGVLRAGCVQEEIMFITSPEMLCSLLFCQVMKDDECIYIRNAIRYCEHTGYSTSFEFKKLLNIFQENQNEKETEQKIQNNHQNQQQNNQNDDNNNNKIISENNNDQQKQADNINIEQQQLQQEQLKEQLQEQKRQDQQIIQNEQQKKQTSILSHPRFNTIVCAIDALSFSERSQLRYEDQFSEQLILRELIKAYVSFSVHHIDEQQIYKQRLDFITGNWGCGAFNGDHTLKFVIQLLAGALCQRNIVYCTFGDKKINHAEELYELIKQKQPYGIFKILNQYQQQQQHQLTLFQFIKKQLA